MGANAIIVSVLGVWLVWCVWFTRVTYRCYFCHGPYRDEMFVRDHGTTGAFRRICEQCLAKRATRGTR